MAQRENPDEEKTVTVTDLYESSLRQEEILSKICNGMESLILAIEKVGVRIQNVETTMKQVPIVSSSAPADKPDPIKINSEPRGNLVLPPGSSRPFVREENSRSIESVAAKQVLEEERAAREEAIASARQKDDAERLERLEEERKRKFEEGERARVAAEEKAEADRLKKEQLESKARLLMSDLITNVPSGLFGDETEEPTVERSGGLFDD